MGELSRPIAGFTVRIVEIEKITLTELGIFLTPAFLFGSCTTILYIPGPG
jgi:hypothetical protein